LITVWHLIDDLEARFKDLGAPPRMDRSGPQDRDLVRQLESLDDEVILRDPGYGRLTLTDAGPDHHSGQLLRAARLNDHFRIRWHVPLTG
jgi:hypothetical protein